jgi:uncharacterized protein
MVLPAEMPRFALRSPAFSRRSLLLGGAAGLAAAPFRIARAASSAKILIAGDSMVAGGFGLFLARDLKKHHGYAARRRGKSSSGLARPDFFDWIEEAERLVAEEQPDASVVMFGGNDVQGLYMGKGEWIRWHEEGWTVEYAARIDRFCDLLAPNGERIFWVGMPVMRPTKFHERMKRVNTIFSAQMVIRPGAKFIDIWSLLADPEGGYADRIHLGPPPAEGERRVKKVRVRAGDGIHLSPAGAQHLANHVRAIVHAELSGETAETL